MFILADKIVDEIAEKSGRPYRGNFPPETHHFSQTVVSSSTRTAIKIPSFTVHQEFSSQAGRFASRTECFNHKRSRPILRDTRTILLYFSEKFKIPTL